MRLSRAALDAIHALVYLATRKGGGPVASHHIAQARGIPEKFLLKIFQPLVKAGILRSIKGPNGGFWLAKGAKNITLLEVVEAANGPLHGLADFEGEDADGLRGRLQAICDRAADGVRRQLQKVRLSELTGKR